MVKKKVTIVTHSGNFHADEIFAVAVLFLVLEKDNDISVVRSRDMEIIEKADYVLDVGRIYDESKNRFDHHQSGGAGKRDNGIPYASFGLIWKVYGKKLCGNYEVALRIDKILIQPIDAVDNGIQFVETKIEGVYPYVIGDFFDAFKPSWKESSENKDKIFINMVSYAKNLLQREIIKNNDKLEAQSIVEKIYNESEDKRLIILDTYLPHDEVLSKFPEPLFVIFPRDNSYWAIQTIRNDRNSFIDRKSLPESWAGKIGEELEKITGVTGAVFCHNGRFMAVNKTKEGILQMAKIALGN